MGTTSSLRALSVPTVAGDTGTWGNELNNTIGFLDTILGGSITFNSSGAATVTLTSSQAQFGRIVFSGTPASSMTLFFSTDAGSFGNYNVWNATSTSANSGLGFNILCQVTSTSTGATCTVPISDMRMVNVDGQNAQFADQTVIPTVTLPPVLNGYLAGLTMSNASTNSSNALAFTAGIATDTTNFTYLQSAAGFNKTSSATWAQGSGNGGMGTGLSFSAGTVYHVFIISNGGSSNIDFYFDTSLTAANKPANTNYFRRIGSMLTTTSAAAWRGFVQANNDFIYTGMANEVNGAFQTSSNTLTTVTVPTGFVLWHNGRYHVSGAAANASLFVQSPDEGVSSTSAFFTGDLTNITDGGTQFVSDTRLVTRTNASGQISVWTNGSLTGTMNTIGWTDTRGTL